MREVCFCDWTGDVADREPIPTRDGDWMLACPQCGHLDDLHWLPEAARAELVADAQQRASSRAIAERAGVSAPRALQERPPRATLDRVRAWVCMA